MGSLGHTCASKMCLVQRGQLIPTFVMLLTDSSCYVHHRPYVRHTSRYSVDASRKLRNIDVGNGMCRRAHGNGYAQNFSSRQISDHKICHRWFRLSGPDATW